MIHTLKLRRVLTGPRRFRYTLDLGLGLLTRSYQQILSKKMEALIGSLFTERCVTQIRSQPMQNTYQRRCTFRTLDRRRGHQTSACYQEMGHSLVSRYRYAYPYLYKLLSLRSVSKYMPGRTDDQCAKRWRENLDPTISRKPWTTDEDRLLMERYELLGKQWREIATLIDGRAPVHCRNRFQSLIRAKKRSKTTGVGREEWRNLSIHDVPTTSNSPNNSCDVGNPLYSINVY